MQISAILAERESLDKNSWAATHLFKRSYRTVDSFFPPLLFSWCQNEQAQPKTRIGARLSEVGKMLAEKR